MELKDKKKKFFFNFIFVFLIFTIDRFTKIYVVELFKKNFDNNLYNSEFLNIYLIWNEGIAFGLMSFNEKDLYNLLTVFIILVTLIVLYIGFLNEGLKRYAMLCIFAGSIGNLFDRITYKAVPDFIDFHIGEFHWFIFNVADIFISIGVLIMIMSEFFGKNNDDKGK